MFERDPEFKVDLSKAFDFKNFHEDTLETVPKNVWLQKQFRALFLEHQNQEYTQNLYKLADGDNVLATFERIRREAQDLQFLSMVLFGKKKNLKNRPPITPVFSYQNAAAFSNFVGKFMFTTRKNRRYFDVKIKLRHDPPSIVSRNTPPGQHIVFEVNAPLEQYHKFAETITRSLLSGELLIDVITNKLWPELDKIAPPLLPIEKPAVDEVPRPVPAPAEAPADAAVAADAAQVELAAEVPAEAPVEAVADAPAEILAEAPAEPPVEAPIEFPPAEVPAVVFAEVPVEAPPTPAVDEIAPADPKPMGQPPSLLELKEPMRVGGAFGVQRARGAPPGRGGFGAAPEEPAYFGGRGGRGGQRGNGGTGGYRGGGRGNREQSADRVGRGGGRGNREQSADRGGRSGVRIRGFSGPPPPLRPQPQQFDGPAPAGGFGIMDNVENFNPAGPGAPSNHTNGRTGFATRGKPYDKSGGFNSSNWRS